MPTATVSQTVFGCIASQFTQGILETCSVTVPAGATRYLLFYNQLNSTPSAPATAAAAFNTTPATGSELIGGLSAAQLRNVVNWDFSALGPPDTPTPTRTITPIPTFTPTPVGIVVPPLPPLLPGPSIAPPPPASLGFPPPASSVPCSNPVRRAAFLTPPASGEAIGGLPRPAIVAVWRPDGQIAGT